jgi:hypothetical protein
MPMSRAFVLVLLAGLAATGCWDRKSSPAGATAATTAAPPADAAARAGGLKLPQTATAKLHGRTVDEYGPDLLDLDANTSLAAAQALQKMGPEALRWFYKGLRSGIPHAEEYSMVLLPGEDARPYVDLFEPLILPLLNDKPDRGYFIRSNAAARLIQMRSEAGIKKARELSQDPKRPADERQNISVTLKHYGY